MQKTSLFLCLLVLILWACNEDEPEPIVQGDEQALTTTLTQIYEDANFPGFTIGIVQNGTISYQNSFGFKNTEQMQAYTNQTIHPIGSISKTFIGAALVKAISLGYLDLETPINDILPTPLVNPKNPGANILVRHLVEHTSGLVDEGTTYLSTYYLDTQEVPSSEIQGILNAAGITHRPARSLAELINAYYYPGGELYSEDNFAAAEPGTAYQYSNLASSLAAYLVELAAGVPYEDFLRTNVLQPLGMTSTDFVKENLPQEQLATLYFDEGVALPSYALESFPDGALRTSNDDLSLYLQDMIMGQSGSSEVLFPQSYYQLLFEKQENTGHSIFWTVNVNGDINHSGSDPGLSTILGFNSESKVGYFILSNYDSSDDGKEAHFEETQQAINASVLQFMGL